MTIPYPTDPSLPSNPAPLFSDSTAARGDHLRANNAEIWANFDYIVSTILGSAVLSTDGTFANIVDTLFPSVKAVKTFIDSMFPHGIVMDYAGVNIPGTFWAACNGNSYLRVSYPQCWANLSSTIGTCTISQAEPAIVTINGHGLQSGACIAFLSTGSLPSPLEVETNYYVTVINADTFKLSTSYTNYLAGTWITTTNAGSGVHTLRSNPWGIVDATHFNVPDTQGVGTEGSGTQGYADWHSSEYNGGLGQYKQDQMQLLTGSWGPAITIWPLPASPVGIFKDSLVSAAGGGGSGGNYARGTLDLNSANSPGARTGLITAGPRVGVNKMIRML